MIGTVFLETDLIAPSGLAARMIYVADPELGAKTFALKSVMRRWLWVGSTWGCASGNVLVRS